MSLTRTAEHHVRLGALTVIGVGLLLIAADVLPSLGGGAPSSAHAASAPRKLTRSSPVSAALATATLPPTPKLTPTPTPTPTRTSTPTPAPTPTRVPAASQTPATAPAAPEQAALLAASPIAAGDAWAQLWPYALPEIVPASEAAALCTEFAVRNVTDLVFLGDSFAINLAIDVRRGLLGEASAPTRGECWAQRRGGLGGAECTRGVVCGGALHVRYTRSHISMEAFGSDAEMTEALRTIAGVALPPERQGRRTAILMWHFLWFLAGDYTSMASALPRIGAEVPAQLALLRQTHASPELVAVLGPSWPWCESFEKRPYCPKQGPENIRVVGEALREAASHEGARFVDLLDLSHAAGIGHFTDGSHPGFALNVVAFRLALRSIFSS